MPDLAPLKLDVIARTSPFVRELGKARKSAMSFAGAVRKNVGGSLSSMGRALKSTTGLLSIFTGATGVGGLIAQSVKLAAVAEQTEVAFATMLGSAEKAKKVVSQLDAFSAATPFEPAEVRASARQLLAFGVRQEDLISRFRVLGDVAAGSNSRIGDLVSIFGKARSAGIVALGDLNQLGDRGIPIFETLKRQLKLSGSELRSFVSAGKLGFPDLLKALESMSKEGGLFADAMKRQSETLGGLFSTIKGEFGRVLEDFGKAVSDSGKLKKNMEDLIGILRGADLKPIVKAFEGAAGFVADVVVGLGRVQALALQQSARQEERLIDQAVRRNNPEQAEFHRKRLLSIRKEQAKLLASFEAAERDKHRRKFHVEWERRIKEQQRRLAQFEFEQKKKMGLIPEAKIDLTGKGGPGGDRFGPLDPRLAKAARADVVWYAKHIADEIAKKTLKFDVSRAAPGAKARGVRIGPTGALPGEPEPFLTGGGPLATPFSQPRLSSAAQFGTGGALSALNRARTGQSTDGQKIVEELRKLGTRLREIHVALAKNPPTRLVPAGLDRA